MRIKITLKTNPQIIPVNYQHFLSSAIYTYLATSDKNFSTKLHNSKNFKFFTFSWLQIPKKHIVDSSIKILSSEMFWYISSPWNEFVQNFVNGLLELGGLRIGQHNFPITQTEAITSVNIHNELNKFICLSPIVVTTKREYNGKLCKYYYKPTDNLEEISEKIGQNLINKYKSFYGKEPQNTSLKIEFDKNYIKTPRAQVLSHYIKDDLDIKIPAIMCPFIATGSVELVKFGYECGFGELNSAGFGMVRMV